MMCDVAGVFLCGGNALLCDVTMDRTTMTTAMGNAASKNYFRTPISGHQERMSDGIYEPFKAAEYLLQIARENGAPRAL